MADPTPAPKTYFSRSTWVVSIGSVLAAVAVCVATIAPDLHAVAPWFGPAHQRIVLALGVLLAAIGSILSHKGGTESTSDLRQDVRAAGLPVPAEAGQDASPRR